MWKKSYKSDAYKKHINNLGSSVSSDCSNSNEQRVFDLISDCSGGWGDTWARVSSLDVEEYSSNYFVITVEFSVRYSGDDYSFDARTGDFAVDRALSQMKDRLSRRGYGYSIRPSYSWE